MSKAYLLDPDTLLVPRRAFSPGGEVVGDALVKIDRRDSECETWFPVAVPLPDHWRAEFLAMFPVEKRPVILEKHSSTLTGIALDVRPALELPLTVEEAAPFLRCSTYTMRLCCRNGLIKASRLGSGPFLIMPSEIRRAQKEGAFPMPSGPKKRTRYQR